MRGRHPAAPRRAGAAARVADDRVRRRGRSAEAKAPARSRKAHGRPHPAGGAGAELRRPREELQTTREEMQTSQEELRSANEEMQSTNEELQSTNEELTTSKEEMQSLNEELQTVNAELQAKVDELSRANNDMKNLLNSTDIATLFLDNDLSVRRFTTEATKIIKLIPGDVGRPITDLASDLIYPELARTRSRFCEPRLHREAGQAPTDAGFRAHQALSDARRPHRRVVITFMNITTTKLLEETLRRTPSSLEVREMKGKMREDDPRRLAPAGGGTSW